MVIALHSTATPVEATSIALSSHAAGDLILIAAAGSSGTAGGIVVPAGWIVLGIRYAAFRHLILAGKWATGSSEVSGTWPGATLLASTVYRHPTNVIGSSGVALAAATTTTVTYAAIVDAGDGGTVGKLGAPLGVFVACGMCNSNSMALETPPSGYSFRAGIAGSGAMELVMHDTGATEIPSIASASTTIASSTIYATVVVGLFDTGLAKAGGGSSSFSPLGGRAFSGSRS